MKILYGVTAGQSADILMKGQLAWMRERGWDVAIVSAPGAELDRAAAREGVRAVPIPMEREISPVADLRSLITWLRTIRRMRPDVVSVGTPKASLLGMISACALRVPRRVYNVLGLRLEGTHGLKHAILWIAERITAMLATDVVAVSPSLADELVRRRIVRQSRIAVVGDGSSNGVDSNAVRAAATPEARQKFRDSVQIPDDGLVIGFLGRINVDKGLDTVLAALQEPSLRGRQDFTFVCIGGVEDEDLLNRLHGATDRLTHLPHTQRPWEAIAGMDVLCLPTRREGLPNVVLEAASAGIPSVVTDATGARDAVVDEVTGLIVPVGDHQALAEALSRMLDDPELRRRTGEAARARVDTDFQPERIWEGLEKIARGATSADVRRGTSAPH